VVGRQKKKVLAERLKQVLSEIKLTHAAQIPWGELYTDVSEDESVIEFAWKDANVVLFMSTVDDGSLKAPP